MNQQKLEILDAALSRYFSAFDGTRKLASSLIAKREHPVEVLILLCARLDALASDAAREDASSRKAFTSFVVAYGGQKEFFNSVSVADLYYELAYQRWLLAVMIPEPGRIHTFSRLDQPMAHLLEDAGLPLTLEQSQVLLDTLIRICRQEYRVTPGQRLSKPRTVAMRSFQDLIVERAERTRLKKFAKNLPGALVALLETKKISNILYQRFRCEAIHGATIILDERRFFAESVPYWKPLESEYYGAYELLEFPSNFLLSLLERCLHTYRAALLAKGRLPPHVHFHAFADNTLEALDLLDTALLPEGGRIRLKIDR